MHVDKHAVKSYRISHATRGAVQEGERGEGNKRERERVVGKAARGPGGGPGWQMKSGATPYRDAAGGEGGPRPLNWIASFTGALLTKISSFSWRTARGSQCMPSHGVVNLGLRYAVHVLYFGDSKTNTALMALTEAENYYRRGRERA